MNNIRKLQTTAVAVTICLSLTNSMFSSAVQDVTENVSLIANSYEEIKNLDEDAIIDYAYNRLYREMDPDEHIYTYQEIMEMDDEEFLIYLYNVEEEWGDSETLLQAGYGCYDLTDAEKFERYFELTNTLFPSDEERWMNRFFEKVYIENEDPYYFEYQEKESTATNRPFMRIAMPYDIELDPNMTADYFGLPSNWEVTYFEGKYSSNFYRYYHRYIVYIDLDWCKDFEKFVRMETAALCLWNTYSDEVLSVHNPFQVYVGGDEGSSSLCGDANSNEKLDISDAVKLMNYVTDPISNPLTIEEKGRCDVYQTGDGISSQDALAVQKYLCGLITELPESYHENYTSYDEI